MRQFQTSVLERREPLTDGFATQPFECAWASEAIFFLSLQTAEPASVRLTARVQISSDGIRWIDEGSGVEDIGAPGDWFIRVSRFGGWLRMRFQVDGDGRLIGSIRLALKE